MRDRIGKAALACAFVTLTWMAVADPGHSALSNFEAQKHLEQKGTK